MSTKAKKVATERPGRDALKRVEVRSRAELRAWLEANHLTSPGIWLVTYKKLHVERHVPYDQVVEELLCFGWIDSTSGKVDDRRAALLCTPRKPKSAWSKANKARIERLVAAGLLWPKGQEMVELAKRTGTWDHLNEVDAMTEPSDLRARLDATPKARTHWDAFPGGVRRQILTWILQAKKPETREKRIHETVTLAAKNVRANQWTPPEKR